MGQKNIEKIIALYENGMEEHRLSKDRCSKIEEITTLHYLNMLIQPGSFILDACAAYGVYSFPLAENGHKVISGDVVIRHVEALKEKQQINPVLQDIYHGNLCDLSRFADNSFDVVLNLGAYYHITDKTERDKSITESSRVLKPNGLLFMAYLNKYATYMKYCDKWQGSGIDFDRYLKRGYSENDGEGLFYATTPEDVENELTGFDFEIVKNIGTDGVRYVFCDSLNNLSEDLYQVFLTHHFEMCERRSLLGYSAHGLVIGKKK